MNSNEHNDGQINPPRWILKFLSWVCPLDLYETIEGDLVEQFHLDINKLGRKNARVKFLFNVLKFVRPGIILRNKFSLQLYKINLLQSYFKITCRHLIKNKAFSFINLTGLAVGMAAAFLMMQYISFESSYDRFHKHADNIYRVYIERYEGSELKYKKAQAFIPTGEALKNEYPEVSDYTTLFKISDQAEVTISRYKENEEIIKFNEESVYHVKGNFFRIFSFPVVSGSENISSIEPKTVWISSTVVKKYFGEDSPVGETIHHSYNGDYKVAGVFQKQPNAHLQPDFLFAWQAVTSEAQGGDNNNWHWDGFYTYILLECSAKPEIVENKLSDFSKKYLGSTNGPFKDSQLRLQPLTDIHLNSRLLGEAHINGDGTVITILKILALFILVIAYINYINLSSAKASERAKEIGIKKIVGAGRGELIWQFLFEAVLLNFLSAFVAMCLITCLLLQFGSFFNVDAALSLSNKKEFWLVLIVLLLSGSFVSGFYPAYIISAFKPAKILKGKVGALAKGFQINLRKGMVTFQFILAMTLMSGTILIYKQIMYMKSQSLGIDINQTLVLKTFVQFGPPGSDSTFLSTLEVMKNALLTNHNIIGAAASYDIPGKEPLSLFSNFRNFKNREELISIYYSRVDYEFINLFNAKLVTGRNFSRDIPTDDQAIVINIEALKTFGFEKPEDAINREAYLGRDSSNLRKLKIIGVVDFRSTAFKQKNYAIAYQTHWAPLRYLSIKFKNLDNDKIGANIEFIKDYWQKYFPEQPFDYFFLDDFFNKQYEAEQKFNRILTLFTALGILIASLGLYGLSSLTVLQRTKEIGIRKVLGASINNLFLLLSIDFARIILIANILALPIIWIWMSNWLDNFAHRTEISWWLFLLPLSIMYFIVLLTVGLQSIKAALNNPIESLRHE